MVFIIVLASFSTPVSAQTTKSKNIFSSVNQQIDNIKLLRMISSRLYQDGIFEFLSTLINIFFQIFAYIFLGPPMW